MIAVPPDSTLGKLYELFTLNGFALSSVRGIERENNLLSADNANCDLRLCLELQTFVLALSVLCFQLCILQAFHHLAHIGSSK